MTRKDLLEKYSRAHESRATVDRDIHILEKHGLIRLMVCKPLDGLKREVYIVNRDRFKEQPDSTFASRQEGLSFSPSRRYRKRSPES